MDVIVRLLACTGFDWDEGNLLKNWERHGVTAAESEQVFFNRPFLALSDEYHSVGEDRFFLLGKTDSDRHLFLAFTIRVDLIRVISARDMSRKERRSYDRYAKEI